MRNLKKFFVFCVFTALLFFQMNVGFSTPVLQARGASGDWFIAIEGAGGTFEEKGQTWEIEYVFETEGLNGFEKFLVYLGRKSDNFLLLFLNVSSTSDNFLAFRFDYKNASLSAEQFKTAFGTTEFIPSPSMIEQYVPTGKIPDYAGANFLVDSSNSQITPESGRIVHEALGQISVYPIYHGVVSSEWHEFWMIGIDETTNRTFFFIFYDVSSTVRVLDLWNGKASNLSLGRAEVGHREVFVKRNIDL